MAEKITNILVEKLSNLLLFPFGKQIIVFIISLMPILEVRGTFIAASLIKLDFLQSVIIAYIGNIIPSIFILFLFDKIYAFMRKSKSKFLNKIVAFLDKKIEKNRKSIEKYEFWALTLFIGIPLPGTGAWTGCLIASVLQMNKKKTFLATLVGVFIATCIMSVLSFAILGNLLNLN